MKLRERRHKQLVSATDVFYNCTSRAMLLVFSFIIDFNFDGQMIIFYRM